VDTHSEGGETMLLSVSTKGQGILEYALILMLVVVVIMIVFVLLGPAIGNMYSNVIFNI
jgi:pilus assembly protein Flp/PilA